MSDKASFACGSDLNIQSASKLKARLEKTLEKQVKTYTLNASKVEKVDTAGLQLLIAFVEEAMSQGSEIQWQKPNDVFLNSTKLLGMQQQLNISVDGGEAL